MKAKKLYTAAELQKLAGINPGTLRNLVALGLPVAKKRKSRRGKPQNLYDAGAVYDWWTHRHIAGKFNWTASAILNRLGKLAGKRTKKKSKPITDAEMRALGIDPASYRAADAALADLAKNPPAMPDLSDYEAVENWLHETGRIRQTCLVPDHQNLGEDLEDIMKPEKMTRKQAERLFNIEITD